MQHLLDLGSAALKKAALTIDAKEFILGNPVLYATLRKAAERYIGGETLADTLQKAVREQARGLQTSIEFMGESTLTADEANAATEEFLRIVAAIEEHQLHCAVSLDLSHIGLAVSKRLCLENIGRIGEAAQQAGIEVMISAEGTERTDAVIDIYQSVAPLYDQIGITMQAYLHRSKEDFRKLIKQKGRIRIVKGAFATPEGLSLPRGAALNEAYLGYVDELLAMGHPVSIATHDAYIQQQACVLIGQHEPADGMFVFESLYGIQTEQLLQLKAAGYPARLYFVYGKEWYLYLCNRIAENPLQLFQALHDIVS